MRLTSDKKLKRNLRTLLLCSRFKTIQNSALIDKYLKEQEDFLTEPENADYRSFLEDTYIRELLAKSDEPYALPIQTHTLAMYKLPDNVNVPRHLRAKKSTHQITVKKLDNCCRFEEEQEDLRKILHADREHSNVSFRVNTVELNDYLNSKNHSKRFQMFTEQMRRGNNAVLLLKYKIDAEALAQETGILNTTFQDKLKQTFSIRDVKFSLGKELKHDLVPKGAAISALVLSGALILSIPNAKDANAHNAEVSPHASYTQTSSYETPSYSDDLEVSIQEGVATPTAPQEALPISNSIKINSYATAGQDFMQKAEEIYKYNTGSEIDLSDLGYDNIGQGGTKILVATLGDKTYSFSTMSNFTTNPENLRRALEAVGATVDSYDTTVTYITRNGKSIAICDASGNPIRSGKVLEESYGGGGQMYNQGYVNSAKTLMERNGISSAGKTDAELVGYYLFNGPSDQNDELSRALGPLVPLASYMRTTFPYHPQGKEDSYAISQYAQKSKKIGDTFNQNAQVQNKIVEDSDKGYEPEI